MKHSIPQGIACILSVSLLLLALAGCSQQAPKEKTVIKMLYTNNFNQMEKLVESTYDDIDLQVEISPYSSEQLRRLERGGGPDLLIASQPDSNLVQSIYWISAIQRPARPMKAPLCPPQSWKEKPI